MAIYHLGVKMVTRESGRSAVASAAYRAGQCLRDERAQLTHDYTHKGGVEHTGILAPDHAPDWIYDRQQLWNTIERIERRRDAQLAREVELGLPLELNREQQWTLLREYVQHTFVDRGMVADLAIHRDNPDNPHAHVMLSTRRISADGFGLKERRWNDLTHLLRWRAAWAEFTNTHLAQAGLAVRIDHRTLKAQGIALTPGRKIGVGKDRQQHPGLPVFVADRVAEQQRIAQDNGRRICADPTVALQALTHTQATFTAHDVARFLHTRTHGAEQFQSAYLKVTTSPELIALGRDERGRERFTSRSMLATEAQLLTHAEQLTRTSAHAVAESRQHAVLFPSDLSAEQRAAFTHLVAAGDLKALVGLAGSGKSRLLAAARDAWEGEGYTVKGAALSGIAAENLAQASGITSRTLASFEFSWQQDRDRLTARDVLVIDEAGLVGTRQLARVLAAAHTAQAKVVLVGDPEQLQAIEAGAPFRGILAHSGVAQLNEVRRQNHPWQREATHALATGDTAAALARYEQHGSVRSFDTRAAARHALLNQWAQDGWAHDAATHPATHRLMLAYTRADVQQLNLAARALRQQHHELGASHDIKTERGIKAFAPNERLYFLRNDKGLGVKNGSLGTIERIQDGVLQVKLDATGHRIGVDTRYYRDLDYGYAATVYKAQGTTVDRSYILATAHYDRHVAYVALSRHRESATVFYAQEDFGSHARFLSVLSRARPKELVHDYLERDPVSERPKITRDFVPQYAARALAQSPEGRSIMDEIEARQQQAADRWRAKQHAREQGLEPTRDTERSRRAGQERATDIHQDKSPPKELDCSRGGPEDDFGP